MDYIEYKEKVFSERPEVRKEYEAKEYIEREAAKRFLVSDYAYAAADMLDKIPAADVALVVHGRWIGRYDHAVKVGWKCSICGCLIFHERDKSNYCPNCGARMDGDAE